MDTSGFIGQKANGKFLIGKSKFEFRGDQTLANHKRGNERLCYIDKGFGYRL
jgi:hypothetical protein